MLVCCCWWGVVFCVGCFPRCQFLYRSSSLVMSLQHTNSSSPTVQIQERRQLVSWFFSDGERQLSDGVCFLVCDRVGCLFSLFVFVLCFYVYVVICWGVYMLCYLLCLLLFFCFCHTVGLWFEHQAYIWVARWWWRRWWWWWTWW